MMTFILILFSKNYIYCLQRFFRYVLKYILCFTSQTHFYSCCKSKNILTFVVPQIYFRTFHLLPRRYSDVTFIMYHATRNLSQHQDEGNGREQRNGNFRSHRKVYRNVVKQLAPTRPMASFVLLQLTVLESHVSVFCEMFRFGKTKLVTFSISEASSLSTHTNPPFSRELIGRWTDRASFTRGLCSSVHIHHTLNYEFQTFIRRSKNCHFRYERYVQKINRSFSVDKNYIIGNNIFTSIW